MEKENCKKNKTTNKGMIRITYEFPVELLDKVPMPEDSTVTQKVALSMALACLHTMGEGREILLSSDDNADVEMLLIEFGPSMFCQAANRLLNDYEEEARAAKEAILSLYHKKYQRLTRKNNEGDN